MDNKQIANKIRELVRENNTTISKMAKDIGQGKNIINSLEKQNSSPSLETICKIADYFNVSIDYIAGREEKNNLPNNIDQSVKDSIVEHNNPIVSNETKENKEISLNDTQRAIVTATNGLDDEQQARVLLYIYQLKKETV